MYAEGFRRILLGATTALLTARMLAPGEDPGMLDILSGPTNLLLPLLWFVAAVGLAFWRAWSRRGDWRGGVVEAALLLAALLVFAGAETAGCKHPARLIAWDWLTLFVVVCLVRQLAVSPGDQQALFAAFLAGAASLSAQAVYQAAVLRTPASATFAQPGPFAAWLALLLPGLFAAHVVCHLRRSTRWQTALTGLFAVLGAAAFVAALVSFFGAPVGTNPPLPDLWRATGKMIGDGPWFGVGPGNFSRAFPRFQDPGGGAVVADPRNFLLEIAATCGVVALLAVLTALGAFFVRVARWLFRKPSEAVETSPEVAPNERTRWEYYIGGMCGLVLGFVIRVSTGDHNPDDILAEGFIACARCLVWLTAFVLFENIPFSGRTRVAALAVGVAALLLVLVVSPGVGLPSVTVALWAAVALGLNGLPQPDYPRVNKLALTRILPVAVTVLVALLYFLNDFDPATRCAYNVREAVLQGKAYRKAVEGKDPASYAESLNKNVLAPLRHAAKDDPDDARVPVLLARWTGELWTLRPGDQLGLKLAKDAVTFAQKAEDLDPQGRDGYDAEHNVRRQFARFLEGFSQMPSLAAAVGPAYRSFPDETRWPHPLGRGAIDTLKKQYREAVQAKKEEEINPRQPAIQYLEAADALEKYRKYDPNDAELRFRLAETLFKAWEDDRCREQAAEALPLDAASAHPPLTDEQRQKLLFWKDLPPPG